MNQLIQIALEDLSNCFGINENLYEKYYQKEVLESEILMSLIKTRSEIIEQWHQKTPLGGPGTVLCGVVLYSLVRHYKLQKILETGVSGGFYTSFILAALKENKNDGILTSIEISENMKEIGKYIPESLKNKWNLISGTDSLSFLKNRTPQQYEYQLYCHDSLHTMSHMMKEVLEFKKCSLNNFLIYVDDQNSDEFWKKCLQTGVFKKPNYGVKYISGAESRLNGHLGGFLKYERNIEI